MTDIQTQAKPNNLAAIDKKIADGKAAEQAALHAPSPSQMQGEQVQPVSASPAPAPQGDNSATKN